MRRPRLTYANVTSTLALVLALGTSSAYAAGLVTSRDIKNGTIRSVDIANRSIKQQDVAPGSLGSRAIKDRSVKKRDLGYVGVSDVEWVSETYVTGSWIRAAGGAVCSPGKKVIGGMASTSGAGDFLALQAVELVPADGENAARVVGRAHEHTPTDADWTLTVTAVCAYVG